MNDTISPGVVAHSATIEGVDAREARLLGILGGLPEAVVAFSGGVDSSYLAWAAQRALGARATAVTALSPSVPEVQRSMAREIASVVGIRHEQIETHEMDREGYRANSVLRCYFCKSELYDRLRDLAAARGWTYVLSGTNADDLGDYRPGLKAAAEHEVRHPLVEAGLSKADIRFLSRRAGLPTWDAPASPCLSSRIPFGLEVTVEKLGQIEVAEAAMRELGFAELRIRHHGDVARLEVPLARLADVLASRAEVVARVKAAGFRHVALDLEGFRSGNLNPV